MSRRHTHKDPVSRKPRFGLYRDGEEGPVLVADLGTVRLTRARKVASQYKTDGCWIARVSAPNGPRWPVRPPQVRAEHKFELTDIKKTKDLNFAIDRIRPQQQSHRRKV